MALNYPRRCPHELVAFERLGIGYRPHYAKAEDHVYGVLTVHRIIDLVSDAGRTIRSACLPGVVACAGSCAFPFQIGVVPSTLCRGNLLHMSPIPGAASGYHFLSVGRVAGFPSSIDAFAILQVFRRQALSVLLSPGPLVCAKFFRV